jgi:hypothetical protein
MRFSSLTGIVLYFHRIYKRMSYLMKIPFLKLTAGLVVNQIYIFFIINVAWGGDQAGSLKSVYEGEE